MFPLLALVILAAIPSISKAMHESCNVTTKDPYIEVGSDAKIVYQTSRVHGKVFWTLNNMPINESLSYSVNSSFMVLSLRNFTHSHATLQCHSAYTQQILGGTIIRTYSKPTQVSCILHSMSQAAGWLGVPELFTCSWHHKTDSNLKISYTVLCSSCPTLHEICNSHETTCTVNYSSIERKVPLVGKCSITVRAKSTAWEVLSEPYEFKPSNRLKIIPPTLNVTTISDQLLVGWQMTRISTKKYRCQVKYSKAVDDGSPKWVLNKTLEKLDDKAAVTIEKVESCSNYTFEVRCAVGEAPWSDWSPEKTVLTKQNKSDVRLHLWREVTEAGKSGVRKVRAMWREIPSTCQDTFNYTITSTPYKEHMAGENYPDTLCVSSVCDVDVNQDAHRIKLSVLHNGSLFVEDSVYVPAIGESLPKVTEIQTTTGEGVFLVSWKPPVQPVSGYMIDYTHNGNQFQWKETKHTSATLFDLLDKKPYNITVTPLFDGKTGHGTQVLQICSRQGGPGNFTNINVKATHRSANVSWTMKSQEACSGDVVNYTVFYSRQNAPMLNVTVNGTMQDVILKDLNPDTQYSIYVKATADTGTTKSSERLFKTRRFDPRLSTALIVCGIIFVVLVLFVGLCCAIQWRKFNEKPVPNPEHSSLMPWLLQRHDQGICPPLPVSDPSESICDRVYIKETQGITTPRAPTGSMGDPASYQVEEYIDPATVPAPAAQKEEPGKPEEAEHPMSPGESTQLLSSENSPSRPYRSQSCVETPVLRNNKQSRHVAVKVQEKTPPVTVYVTLDMFDPETV